MRKPGSCLRPLAFYFWVCVCLKAWMKEWTLGEKGRLGEGLLLLVVR